MRLYCNKTEGEKTAFFFSLSLRSSYIAAGNQQRCKGGEQSNWFSFWLMEWLLLAPRERGIQCIWRRRRPLLIPVCVSLPLSLCIFSLYSLSAKQTKKIAFSWFREGWITRQKERSHTYSAAETKMTQTEQSPFSPILFLLKREKYRYVSLSSSS